MCYSFNIHKSVFRIIKIVPVIQNSLIFLDSLEDNDGFPDYYYDVRGQRTSSPVYRYNTRRKNLIKQFKFI